MDREDILAMSREENDGRLDEREQMMLGKIGKIKSLVGGVICVLLVLVCELIFHKPEVSLCAWLVYFSMQLTNDWMMYALKKERMYLIYGIINSVIMLAIVVTLPLALR